MDCKSIHGDPLRVRLRKYGILHRSSQFLGLAVPYTVDILDQPSDFAPMYKSFYSTKASRRFGAVSYSESTATISIFAQNFLINFGLKGLVRPFI